MFDALIPLPNGTSYNAYLILGESKNALIDTVNPGFETELDEKLNQITRPRDLDYIVMNHAEPDHAGAIPHLMKINNKAKLITSNRGATMAEVFYQVPKERILAIGDMGTVDLGGKILQFIEAPMLHWPETMFTYLKEDGVLFPCDFFGSHAAGPLYSDDMEDLAVHAQRYFGEIMMPFRTMAQNALNKIGNLRIDMIAPSHGPIHRNPKRILEAYSEWSKGETKQKVAIIYVTMWKSTEKMIQPMADTLMSNGIEIAVHDLTTADLGNIAKDLVDSKAIVLGAPTVLGGAHPLAVQATYLVRALRPPTKFLVLLSSHGWTGGAIKQIQEVLGASKIEVVGALDTYGPPSENDIRQVVELGKTLAAKIKG